MEPSELLHFLAGVLDRLQLPYFVTGSTVTIFYGEPRFTNDIDVVVALPESMVAIFCRQFPVEEFYVDEEAVRVRPLSTQRDSNTDFGRAPIDCVCEQAINAKTGDHKRKESERDEKAG